MFNRVGMPRRFVLPPLPGRRYPGLAIVGPPVLCQEQGREVPYIDCLKCERFAVWHAKDESFRRCWHKFKDLESRGYYDDTWDDHPENFDPETFARLQEEKRHREDVLREMEADKAELARLAEELAQKAWHDRSCDSCGPYDDDEDEEAEKTARADEDEYEYER